MGASAELKDVRLGIVGAGAAGLTAALTAARFGLSPIIFEAKNAGGRAGGIPFIESYPGLPKVKGTEFVKALKKQVSELTNIYLHEFEPVQEIRYESGQYKLITGKDKYLFDNLILAMGVEHKHLNVTGEMKFKGKGVSYCAACDGLFFRNKNTVVIGNDTHALEQALFLDGLESNVTLITPEPKINAEPKLCSDLMSTSVEIITNAKVEEIYGEKLVGGVKVLSASEIAEERPHDKSNTLNLEAKGVFISVGWEPRTELAGGLEVSKRENGCIKVNEKFQTDSPNVYAIGDLTAPDLELVSICASGAAAVKAIIANL